MYIIEDVRRQIRQREALAEIHAAELDIAERMLRLLNFEAETKLALSGQGGNLCL